MRYAQGSCPAGVEKEAVQGTRVQRVPDLDGTGRPGPSECFPDLILNAGAKLHSDIQVLGLV